jgi:hypothetical protein
MGHDKLANHYKTQFSLVQHHKWSLDTLEQMLPWERYIYVDLLQAFLKEEEQKAKDRENELKNKINHANRKRM